MHRGRCLCDCMEVSDNSQRILLLMKEVTHVYSSGGRALTGSQDSEEIVKFGPNKELNQTSNQNLSAQIHVLNPFLSCFLLLLKSASKTDVGRAALTWVQCKAFQCSARTISQAITALQARKTLTISRAYFQHL